MGQEHFNAVKDNHSQPSSRNKMQATTSALTRVPFWLHCSLKHSKTERYAIDDSGSYPPRCFPFCIRKLNNESPTCLPPVVEMLARREI